jgi:hypothetical protein
MSRADCFQALGVASDASWEEVRQAYKDLVGALNVFGISCGNRSLTVAAR